jgi:hypothetical protein
MSSIETISGQNLMPHNTGTTFLTNNFINPATEKSSNQNITDMSTVARNGNLSNFIANSATKTNFVQYSGNQNMGNFDNFSHINNENLQKNFVNQEINYLQNGTNLNFQSNNNSFNNTQNEYKILTNNLVNQNTETNNLNSFNSVYKPGNWFK